MYFKIFISGLSWLSINNKRNSYIYFYNLNYINYVFACTLNKLLLSYCLRKQCATSTDAKCGKDIEDYEESRDEVNGVLVLRDLGASYIAVRVCSLYNPPAYREREKRRRIPRLSSGTDVKGTYSSTLSRDIGRGYDMRHNDT